MNDASVLMVVEDDPNIRALIRDLLTDEGYSVDEAANGAEALAILTTCKPDLILLDLNMPVMSGWAFMQEIRKTGKHMPVIIVSVQVKSKEEAAQLGAVDYLRKTFELADLLEKVAIYSGHS